MGDFSKVRSREQPPLLLPHIMYVQSTAIVLFRLCGLCQQQAVAFCMNHIMYTPPYNMMGTAAVYDSLCILWYRDTPLPYTEYSSTEYCMTAGLLVLYMKRTKVACAAVPSVFSAFPPGAQQYSSIWLGKIPRHPLNNLQSAIAGKRCSSTSQQQQWDERVGAKKGG